MTKLTTYSAANPSHILFESEDFDAISKALGHTGVTLERWKALSAVSADASSDEILAAYKPEIDRLKAERGYATADVIHVRPGNPKWPEMRAKFLSEHIHDEDEVRFFVAGSGSFYLHVGDEVHQITGTPDDLLSVPKGLKHWFDGGPEGYFTVIRIFTEEAGWVAHFTGETIADTIPRFEGALQH